MPYFDHQNAVIGRLVAAGIEENVAQTFFTDYMSVGSARDDGACFAVRHRGEVVTHDVRNELLAKLAGDEHVELEVDIVSFRQKPGVPNRNFMRLVDKKGVMRATAKSGAGMPFLADHDHGHIASRLGTISKSRVEFDDESEAVFLQTLSVATPAGVEGVLRGTIDRFSVGWVATGDVNCSLCGTPVFAECYHFPGQSVQLEEDADSEAAICEWVFTSADLIEVSAVNVPAVVGTGIEEVRASMARNNPTPENPAQKEQRMTHVELCAMLGLPPDTTPDQLKAHTSKLAADSARVSELETRNSTLEANAALAEAQELAIRTERKIQDLKTEGKLTASGGKVEDALRKMAESDYIAFEAYCDQMPTIVPVGTQTQAVSTSASASASTLSAIAAEGNPFLKGMMSGLGLSEDDLVQYGPTRPMGETLLDRDEYKPGGNI